MSRIEDAAARTEVSGLTDPDRIGHAADAIRAMTKDMVDEQPVQRRRLSDILRQMTVEAPLQSLAIAFLLGVLVARRR